MRGLPNINMANVNWKVLENINLENPNIYWDWDLENINLENPNNSNELYQNRNTFYLVYKIMKDFCKELLFQVTFNPKSQSG